MPAWVIVRRSGRLSRWLTWRPADLAAGVLAAGVLPAGVLPADKLAGVLAADKLAGVLAADLAPMAQK